MSEEALYPFGGKMLDLNTIREKAFDMLSNAKGCEIPPEALLGFRTGNHLDFTKYSKLGFTHPKSPSYYEYKGENSDPDFKRIYDGIKERGGIDNPIVIYPYECDGEKHLIVIDGATRMSVIGYLRAENPKSFLRVQCSPTPPCTNPDEAQAMMVRLNMEGRGRMLSPYEILESVHRCRSNARWEVADIAKHFGMPVKRANIYLKLHMSLTQPIRILWRDGHLNFDQAKEFSELTREDQAKEAKKIEDRLAKNVKKVAPHAAELREKRREQKRLSNPLRKAKQIEKCLGTLRASYASKPSVEAKLKPHFDNIEKMIRDVRALIEKDLGISCDNESSSETNKGKDRGLGKSLKKLASIGSK